MKRSIRSTSVGRNDRSGVYVKYRDENRENRTITRHPLALATLFALAVWQGSASADDGAAPFELGTVHVTASRPQIGEIGEDQVSSVVTRKDMQQFNRTNVGDAVNLLSGVTLSNNTRNEKMVYIRGYDPRQAPLFIDGIPVYVPYDGYVDFNRFTTADLAAIQVAKGFSSVSYGTNTLGGAINLISRKPTRTLEGDVSVGYGSGREKQTSANVGTNQGTWYLQAGASYLDSDYFPMSSNFSPTKTEDGGHRNNSYRTDTKLSLKFGITPNATDEYSVSYYNQQGEKGQPPSTDPSAPKYWQWPYWNKESLYFISNTALTDREMLKVRLYSDTFENKLKFFKDASYTTLTNPLSGISIYDDKTVGGSVELSSVRIDRNEIKLVAHYKEDQHTARDGAAVTSEHFKDTLVSYAAEDNIRLTQSLMLSVGAIAQSLRPQEVYKTGSNYSLPSVKTKANAQAGLFYDYTEAARFYATVAEKTRLPTLKDRYSARMGDYDENPNLQPEQSTNYEIGYQGTPWAGAKAEAAIFHSEISDMIQSVFVGAVGSKCAAPAFKCQMRNVGNVRKSGVELGLRTPLASWLEVGGNYTYLSMRNISDPTTKLTSIPDQKLTLHALVRPIAQVDVIGFIEHDGGRWASNTVHLGGFTTANLKAVYRPEKNLAFEAGVYNLTDKNYQLDDGFPNPGRTWFANATYQF